MICQSVFVVVKALGPWPPCRRLVDRPSSIPLATTGTELFNICLMVAIITCNVIEESFQFAKFYFQQKKLQLALIRIFLLLDILRQRKQLADRLMDNETAFLWITHGF